MTEFNRMQTIKRRFFAMRNGIIADTLRRGGSRFNIIFGLNLPQLVDIAHDYGHDPELGLQLWANYTCRESMLLAPMLLHPEDVDSAKLEAMLAEIADTELADIFCHRFLRHYPEADKIAERLANSARDMDRYIAMRLLLNIRRDHPELAARLASAEIRRDHPLTRRLAAQLL